MSSSSTTTWRWPARSATGSSDHGYRAIAVSSGAEAIARLEAGGVDAVVTDLRMPNVDGLAVLESSRRLEPGRPVIIMTAFSAIDSAVESIRRGANHYLTKPFKQDELLHLPRPRARGGAPAA